MKFNQPSSVRMAYIDRQIRAGKFPNCQQVANEFEVDRKTVQRNIDNMRDLGAPIEYDKKRRGYYYTEPNYFFPSIQLTQSDVFAFVVNEQILKQYQDAPYYQQIKQAIEKIIQFIPDKLASEEMASVFSFQSPPSSPVNKQHFQILQDAAYQERQVKIKYHSQHTDHANERIVDPYAIRNQQGAWYLIGYCHNRNQVRIFALNRILSITPTEVDFYKPTNFDIEEFLKESFSIYRDDKTYHIKLKFSPYQARWIRERQWHKTQQLTKLNDGSLILEMDVQGLDEVKRWVMQYGGEVEVVEPVNLREEIIKELKKMVQQYEV